jgi:hypothetical protein
MYDELRGAGMNGDRQHCVLHRNMQNGRPGRTGHQAGAERQVGSRRHGKGHEPTEAGTAEAETERFTDGFFCGPELEEGDQLTGLIAHPRQLDRVEPSVRQGGDLAGMGLLEVHPERTGEACSRGDQVMGVAEADREARDVGASVGVVAELRRTSEQRTRELEKQCVGRGSGLSAGRRQPDMYGISHRKKVSRCRTTYAHS